MNKIEVILATLESKQFFQSRENVEALVSLDQSDYDQVVLRLLVSEDEPLRTEGCAWFAIRPNAELYLQLLQGATSVVNPSACRDGVVALLQVKSPVEVAVDIHNRLDIDAPDPHNSAIISMFYWLGYMPKALTRNNAWPGYAVKIHLWILDDYSLIASGITTAPLTPASDPARVDLVSRRVITTMLDLFENNSSNQTARGIIALLAPRLGYPDDLLPRIKSIYELAKKSTDDYVRHRVRQYKV